MPDGLAVPPGEAEDGREIGRLRLGSEGQEFRRIAREQGLKAAIRWRDERFK